MRGFRFFVLGILFLVAMGIASNAPAMAQPEDDEPGPLPPGLGVRIFVHYPRDGRPGTVTSPICSDPTTNNTANCDSYGYSGIHWANASGIPYYINPNFNTKKSPKLTKEAAVAAIRASFDTWDAANTKLSYTYKGTAAVKGARLDGVNAVLWSGAMGAIAVTRVWYYTSTGEIVEFDITLGNSWSWTYTPPTVGACDGTPDYPYCDPTNSGVAGTFDVRNITTHETGHSLLLEDLYDATDNDLTMYGYGAQAELKKDTLGKGDVLGVNAIYP